MAKRKNDEKELTFKPNIGNKSTSRSRSRNSAKPFASKSATKEIAVQK